MTPEEAHRLLDGTTPGPWEVDHDHAWAPGVWSPGSIVFGPYWDREDMEQWEAGSAADLRLAAAAPVLAAMIAGMREEWAREARITGGTEWHNLGWCRSRAEAELTDWSFFIPRGATVEYRLVRRYVTEQEEA